MEGYELVRRAIEFDSPERLPFYQDVLPDVPSDVIDSWEMDRAKRGWFFNQGSQEDDWGCIWQRTEKDNMGQVKIHPLEDWSRMKDYSPPDPDDDYYYERVTEELDKAGDRYVVLTCHFNLIERLHMLHGFQHTLIDIYRKPDKIEAVLDLILDFKTSMIRNVRGRFGGRVHGIFFTDDWGTQQGTLIDLQTFRRFFKPRYEKLVRAVHNANLHFILHTCGKVTRFIPEFIDLQIDVLNLQQPRILPIEEVGDRFAGKVCFLTTVDIQSTLPSGTYQEIRKEVEDLIRYWATPNGGLIVFNYGDGTAIGVSQDRTQIMFQAFMKCMSSRTWH